MAHNGLRSGVGTVMNRRRALSLMGGSLAAAAGGCFPRVEDIRPKALWNRIGGSTPNDMLLRTMLVERSAGDAYLNRDLWTGAARPLAHELSTLLAHNGFRVGVCSGVLTGEFERLMHAEASVVDPKERTFHAGQARVIPIHGPIADMPCKVLADLAADPASRNYTALECGLNLTATPVHTDRVKLLCEPQVQYGDKELSLAPSADNTQLTRRERKPLEAFNTLTFDVTLGPDDYLLFGPTEDPTDRLGQAYFRPDGAKQRVLIVRALRPEGIVKPEAMKG